MDNQQHDPKPDTIEVTVAAMGRLGEATAAAIAAEAGLAYSTVTPKLRALEKAGRAERLRTDEGRTLWRLIPADQPADALPDREVDTTTGQADDKLAGPVSTDDIVDDDAAPVGDDSADTTQPVTARRAKGALREAVLKVMQEHPGTAYRVSELSKLLDGASQGAIANALHKLTGEAAVTQTIERPATFQAI